MLCSVLSVGTGLDAVAGQGGLGWAGLGCWLTLIERESFFPLVVVVEGGFVLLPSQAK